MLVLFFQATRKRATIDEVRNYLQQKKFKEDLIDELVIMYKLHKDEFKQKAGTFAPAYLSYVNDVSWALHCNVGSSSLSKDGEISYKIQLTGDSSGFVERKDVVSEFTCSTEELQSLINRLKEVERSCRRVASNVV